MQCMYSKENIPGHCNQTVCSIRPNLPAYYYTDTQQWKMGDEWPAAVLALVVSGVVVLSILTGRYLIPNMLKKIKAALERWQNKSERIERCENEQIWNEQHTWWNKVPVLRWVYGRWKKSNVDYYQLENRAGEDEPPPYRAE
ncbi:hypothetical protein BY458DRAFT_495954 [Sporodiniella umbellata]|nr:hypothetical protein BY458DRAFT_495954 [Sporodiniella umbellata]